FLTSPEFVPAQHRAATQIRAGFLRHLKSLPNRDPINRRHRHDDALPTQAVIAPFPRSDLTSHRTALESAPVARNKFFRCFSLKHGDAAYLIIDVPFESETRGRVMPTSSVAKIIYTSIVLSDV